MNNTLQLNELEADAEIKACCAAVYQSDWARLLLGPSLHPGGLTLTERLGDLMDLRPGQRVLDVAAGSGTSALFLAKRYGCHVTGIDYGAESVALANKAAADAGLAELVQFRQADAEGLPFDDNSFSALICECAFCTFPDKSIAAAEMSRVLHPGGKLGLSDITRSGTLPAELDTLLAYVACIADAQPVEKYADYLTVAGMTINQVETHDQALSQMVHDMRGKLLGAELLVNLKKIDLPGADFDQARAIARSATEAIQQGKLGYSLLLAIR
jgi:ubiquinone/menaquinone biosynthesis C-methylase UbiE